MSLALQQIACDLASLELENVVNPGFVDLHDGSPLSTGGIGWGRFALSIKLHRWDRMVGTPMIGTPMIGTPVILSSLPCLSLHQPSELQCLSPTSTMTVGIRPGRKTFRLANYLTAVGHCAHHARESSESIVMVSSSHFVAESLIVHN